MKWKRKWKKLKQHIQLIYCVSCKYKTEGNCFGCKLKELMEENRQ